MKNLSYPVGPSQLFLSTVVCASVLGLSGCECECFENISKSLRASSSTSEPVEKTAESTESNERIVFEIDPKVDGDADMELVQITPARSANAAW